MLVPPHAHDQQGAFSRRQALDAGFSARTIRRRLASGDWMEWMPTGYHLRGVHPGPVGRIAVAASIVDGVVSHASAAFLHGIADENAAAWAAGPVHLVTSRPRHEHIAGTVEHRLRLPEHAVTEVLGIPAMTRTATVVELLAWLPERQARRYLFRAVQQQWLTAEDLHAELEHWGWRNGVRRLRSFTTYLTTGAHSGGEWELHRLLAGAGISFAANVPLPLPGGSAPVVDVLLDGTRVVIEVDGREYHADATRFQHDRTRQNRLTVAGYTVLRFTVDDIINRPHHVLDVVRRQSALSA